VLWRRAGDKVKRRVALIRRHRADGRAVRQQEVGSVRVAPLHGQMEQSVSGPVTRIRIRLVLAQHLRDAGLVIAQRQV